MDATGLDVIVDDADDDDTADALVLQTIVNFIFSKQPSHCKITIKLTQCTLPHNLGGAAVRRQTHDRKVAGLTPDRGAIKSTMGQLSLPSLRGR